MNALEFIVLDHPAYALILYLLHTCLDEVFAFDCKPGAPIV